MATPRSSVSTSRHSPPGTAELYLKCPSCNGEVTVPRAEAWPGRRVGCLHCGVESWLDREDGDEGPGRWLLVSEWLEDEP